MKRRFLFFWCFKKLIILFLIYKTKVFVKLLKLMIIFIFYLLPLLIFLRGVIVYVSRRAHLLATLLRLEFIVLSLFLFLFGGLNLLNYENFFRLVFLTFRVCEGALGLSILVSIIRTHGNDYFQTFSILQC